MFQKAGTYSESFSDMKRLFKTPSIISCGLLYCGALQGMIVNPPACCEEWGIVGSIDYLYWKANPRVTSVIQLSSTSTLNSSSPISSDLKQAPFDWNSGVRASLGFEICDLWTFKTTYTYFQNQIRADYFGLVIVHPTQPFDPITLINMVPGIGQFPPEQTSSLSVYPQTEFHGKLSFNQLDFLFDRTFYLGPKVVFSPVVGVKYLFINQKLSTQSVGELNPRNVNPTFGTVSNKVLDYFSGVGVTAGAESAWNILQDLSIYAKGSLSVLYSYSHIVWKGSSSSNLDFPFTTNDSRLNEVTYTLDGGLGFILCENLFGGKGDLRVGWEWHYISDVTKTPSIPLNPNPLNSNSPTYTDLPSRPCTLQGVVVGVNFVI